METAIWRSYEIGQYLSMREARLVSGAWAFAKSAHAGQFRASGVPFIEHPLAVAQILSRMRLHGTTLAAGLLHDVVEDTAVTYSEIRSEFGAEIGDLVAALTIKTPRDQSTGGESVIQTVRTILADRRLVLIRIADRLHNMRTLNALPRTRREQIAYETLVIYVPLAECLGLVKIRNELQLLALGHLNVSVRAPTDVILRSPMPLYHLYDRYVKTISEWLFQNWIDCSPCGIAPESWPLPAPSGMESAAMKLFLEYCWGDRGALPNLGQ
jgi:(p)ppGpp synthase/HD superfamily hydrolase